MNQRIANITADILVATGIGYFVKLALGNQNPLFPLVFGVLFVAILATAHEMYEYITTHV